jgi:hypothetical protein
MNIKTEILFWQEFAKQPSMLDAIKRHKDRAIRFFGSASVLNQDELSLRYTLDAYYVVATSDDDLLNIMNESKLKTISELPDLSDSEVEKLKLDFLYTLDKIKLMKQRALQHIERKTGHPCSFGD